MNATGDDRDRRAGRELPISAGLFVLSGLTTYFFLLPLGNPTPDPSIGPHVATSRAVACGVVLIALTVGGTVVARPLLVAPAVALPFTAVWAWLAATSDDSGLWPIGATLALAGSALAASAVTALTHTVLRRLRRG